MENYRKLSLCFILICVIFIKFYPQNEVKTVKSDIKKEEIILPSKSVEIVEDIAVEPEVIEEPKVYSDYRLTSFWFNDGYGTSSCTGSGLCEKDFNINDKGWYTYNGKLVLAAATYECLYSHSGACNRWNTKRSDKTYYSYYDEVELIIDGIVYEGIVLDSCGACMYVNNEQRLDLFVSGKQYAIDRGYKGNNVISVFKEVQ